MKKAGENVHAEYYATKIDGMPPKHVYLTMGKLYDAKNAEN